MLSRCQLLAVRGGRPGVTGSLRIAVRSSSVLVSVTPENGLIDVLPRIKVEGLGAKEKVTLQLSTRDSDDMEFSSFAHYVASPGGIVSNMANISVGGRYQGVSPAGLMCSLRTTPEVYMDNSILKYKRLGKTNVTTPLNNVLVKHFTVLVTDGVKIYKENVQYMLTVLPGHLTEGDLYSERRLPKSLATTTFSRTFMAPGVKRIPVEGEKIEGTLFLPAGPGPHPAVLDLFGTEGGLIEQRAAMLASRGFASLGLAYMNYKHLPYRPTSLPLEYFDGAVDYLQNHEHCQKDAIGILGSSKGCDFAIILASRRKEVKAIVTINGASANFNISSTFKGEDIFPIHDDKFEFKRRPDGFSQCLLPEDSFSPESPMSLPVEDIADDCEALLITCDRDGFLTYRAGVALLERARLRGKDNIYNLCLPGAGHVLDVPYLPHIPYTTIKPSNYQGDVKALPIFWFGGNYYDSARATETYWRYALNLFSKKLIHEPEMRKMQEE